MKDYDPIYHNTILKALVCLLITLDLTGCSNKTLKLCENMVWRNQGKSAAMSGKTKGLFNTLQKTCTPYKTPINQEAFIEGFNIGLTLFCQKGRGFVFGKQGKVYLSTCPKKSKLEFLNGYYRGRISYLEKKQVEVKQLFRQSEDRVWRKERDYLIEATQDLVQAEQELDLLDSYKEEAKYLDLEAKKIKLELIQLKKKRAELSFKT